MSVMRGRIVHHKDKELKAWRSLIGWTAKSFLPRPLSGAISIQLDFAFIKPKTVNRDRPSVKPDLDKLIRAVLDALTGIAYTDDSQVVRILAQKSYGSVEGVRVIMAVIE